MKQKLAIIGGLLAFHLAISVIISMIAYSTLLPDYHNGQGLWNFALDSSGYHSQALASFQLLERGTFSEWWTSLFIRHTKYIGLIYYLIYPSPLSFAPINAIAWSANAVTVYLIAMIVCGKNRRFSMLTALIFGLWPSNLMIGTQLLRDPFINLGVLMMLLGWVAMLHSERKIKYSLLIPTGLIFSVSIRPELFWLLIIVSLLAVFIIALRDRRTLPYALLAFLIFTFYYNYPALIASAAQEGLSGKVASGKVVANNEDQKIAAVKKRLKSDIGNAYTDELDKKITDWFTTGSWYSPWKQFETQKHRLEALAEEHGKELDRFLTKWMTPWQYSSWIPLKFEKLIVRANEYRRGFLVTYLAPGSSLIDSDVTFRSVSDVFKYSHRAFVIGFFSPFPNQWFDSGATGGKSIRILGGIEMLAWYLIMAGFILFLVKSPAPRRFKLWIVLFMIIMIMPLGFFVPNIGTLFRMRFVYLAPMLICGLRGLMLGYAAMRPGKGSRESLPINP